VSGAAAPVAPCPVTSSGMPSARGIYWRIQRALVLERGGVRTGAGVPGPGQGVVSFECGMGLVGVVEVRGACVVSRRGGVRSWEPIGGVPLPAVPVSWKRLWWPSRWFCRRMSGCVCSMLCRGGVASPAGPWTVAPDRAGCGCGGCWVPLARALGLQRVEEGACGQAERGAPSVHGLARLPGVL